MPFTSRDANACISVAMLLKGTSVLLGNEFWSELDVTAEVLIELVVKRLVGVDS